MWWGVDGPGWERVVSEGAWRGRGSMLGEEGGGGLRKGMSGGSWRDWERVVGEEGLGYRRWCYSGGWGSLRWGNSNEFLAGGGQVAMKRQRRA